jgi:hypothetical protein
MALVPTCEPSIHLEREEAVYRPGEVIRGHVKISAHAAGRHTLTIALAWRTAGLGVPTGDVEAEETLFEGEWEAGGVETLPFEIRAPRGPLSYEGMLLHVRWFLVAHASAEGEEAVEVEARLALAPWTREALAEQAGGYREAPLKFDGGYAQGLLHAAPQPRAPLMRPVRAPWPLLVAALLMLMTALFLFLETQPGRPWGSGVLGAFLAGASALIWFFARARAPEALGLLQVKVKPRSATPGAPVVLALYFTAERDVTLDEATLSLVGEELVVVNSAGEFGIRRRAIHEDREAVLGPFAARRLRKGEKLVLRRKLLLPADAAPSFGASHNELSWEARGVIVTADGEECRHAARLVVRPVLC